jgi:hypothetical protein
METIDRAAIYYPWPYQCLSVARPGRHSDVIAFARSAGVPKGTDHSKQGFVTNTGRFVDRVEGARIAIAAGQVRLHPKSGNTVLHDGLNWPPYLYSEDMW